MNPIERRANALAGPNRVRSGYALTYRPKRGSHFPWLDSGTNIRYSHDEVREHPTTAAVSGLTRRARHALLEARVVPIDNADGGEDLRAMASAPIATQVVLIRLGLARGPARRFAEPIPLTPLGVEVATLLGHP